MIQSRPMLSRGTLRRASRRCPEGVMRLARALGLCVAGMSPRQAANLIYWRMSRRG